MWIVVVCVDVMQAIDDHVSHSSVEHVSCQIHGSNSALKLFAIAAISTIGQVKDHV